MAAGHSAVEQRLLRALGETQRGLGVSSIPLLWNLAPALRLDSLHRCGMGLGVPGASEVNVR
jgi:hypothetical protein